MEALGSSLLIILLFVGLLLLLLRKFRKVGALMILISLTYTYIIPLISFKIFKKGIIGTYVDNNGSKIIIDNNYEYTVVVHGNEIFNGDVEFSNYDSPCAHFSYDPNLNLTSDDKIINEDDNRIIYKKE